MLLFFQFPLPLQRKIEAKLREKIMEKCSLLAEGRKVVMHMHDFSINTANIYIYIYVASKNLMLIFIFTLPIFKMEKNNQCFIERSLVI